MIKTKLKKYFVAIASFAFALALALPCFATGAFAYDPEFVDSSLAPSESFASDMGSWSALYDTDTSLSSSQQYAVGFKTDASVSKMGDLDSSLGADGYVIARTNVKNDDVAVYAGFTSPSVSLDPDSFYKFSVDVNAKASSAQGGAFFKIAGLDDEIYFGNGDPINTSGWEKYSIFIATSQLSGGSATLSLTLGDDGMKSSGYAAFKNVSVSKINESNYLECSVDPAVTAIDYRLSDYLSLEDFETEPEVEFSDETNAFSVSTTTVTGPDGNAANKALVLASSSQNGGYGSVNLKADAMKFNRLTAATKGEACYLVTYYAKADAMDGSASAVLHYKSENSSTYSADSVASVSTMFVSPNLSHNDWALNYVFVKSSVITPFDAYLEFTYGTSSAPATGTYYVDDIRVYEISFADYVKYNASTDLSSLVAADLDSKISDTINGHFYLINSSDTEVLTPDVWTVNDSTDSADVTYRLVDNERVPLDFESKNTDAFNPVGNVVEIAAEKPVIFSIKSNACSATASEDGDGYNKVSVLLGGVDLAGSGANITLTNSDGKILSSFRNIKTSAPTVYTFLIRNRSEMTFYINVGLGVNAYGKDYPGYGKLYVAKVNYSVSSLEEYEDVSATRKQVNLYYDSYNDYTVYDELDASDIKNTDDYLATLTLNSNGSAKHGILDVSAIGEGNTFFAPGTGDENLIAYAGGIKKVYAVNVSNANAKLRFNGAMILAFDKGDDSSSSDANTDAETETYWKITVSVRAILDSAYGANISLVSSETVASLNVKDTREFNEDGQVIKDKFVDYTFFVKLNGADETVNLVIDFGGAKTSQRTSGFLLIRDYQAEQSYSTAFNEAKESGDSRIACRDLSEGKSSSTTTTATQYNDATSWYLVPSILFAVLILVAVVGWLIRRRVDKKKAEKEKEAAIEKKGRPAYANRVDYSKEEKPEEKPENEEDYDMYAVTEAKAPEENVTAEPETAEEKAEEKPEDQSEDKPEEKTEEKPQLDRTPKEPVKNAMDDFDD